MAVSNADTWAFVTSNRCFCYRSIRIWHSFDYLYIVSEVDLSEFGYGSPRGFYSYLHDIFENTIS